MRLEIEVGAIGDAHQLVPLPLFLFTLRKKAILNVDGAFRVMRQLFFGLFVEPQVRVRDTDRLKPLMTGIDPFLMRLFVLAGFDEVFHLHLFKLAGTKDEVAGRDFIAKRLANLRDPERQLAPAGIQHVEKVYEDALRGFGPKIDQRFRIVFRRRPYVRAKHQVEWTDSGPVNFPTIWTRNIVEKFPSNDNDFHAECRNLLQPILFQLVGSKSALAFTTVNQRIAESVFVTGILPDQTIQNDR